MNQNTKPNKSYPIIPSCNLYYRKKEFFIISKTEIKNGTIGTEPVFRTSILKEVGELIMKSLASKGRWPDYVIGPGYDPDELMIPYGFKKWTIFTRGTIYIPIYQKGKQLTLSKYRPRGGRVLGLTTDPEYICDADAESVVRLVAELLELPDPFVETRK